MSHISDPPAPVFAEVREQVVQDWTAEKSKELSEQFYTNLRDQYTLVIEQPAVSDRVAVVSE